MSSIVGEIDYKELLQQFSLFNKREVSTAVNKALSKVAIQIRRDSINKVPRAKGGLINSWKVEKSDLTIEMGYDIIYAMYQHQGRRADGTHIIRNRPAGGQSYYLSEPLNQNLDKYFELFETEIINYFNL